jgi:hypothetical protein
MAEMAGQSIRFGGVDPTLGQAIWAGNAARSNERVAGIQSRSNEKIAGMEAGTQRYGMDKSFDAQALQLAAQKEQQLAGFQDMRRQEQFQESVMKTQQGHETSLVELKNKYDMENRDWTAQQHKEWSDKYMKAQKDNANFQNYMALIGLKMGMTESALKRKDAAKNYKIMLGLRDRADTTVRANKEVSTYSEALANQIAKERTESVVGETDLSRIQESVANDTTLFKTGGSKPPEVWVNMTADRISKETAGRITPVIEGGRIALKLNQGHTPYDIIKAKAVIKGYTEKVAVPSSAVRAIGGLVSGKEFPADTAKKQLAELNRLMMDLEIPPQGDSDEVKKIKENISAARQIASGTSGDDTIKHLLDELGADNTGYGSVPSMDDLIQGINTLFQTSVANDPDFLQSPVGQELSKLVSF